MDRRSFLAMAGLPLGFSAGPPPAVAGDQDRPVGSLRLQETAGLRRFGYPVHVRLPDQGPLRGVPESRFRLERHGRDVSAQFHRVRQADGGSVLEVDFNASPGPFELEVYTLHDDPRLPSGRETRRGIHVQQGLPIIQVANGPHIAYRLDDHLQGFVRSVRTPALEFLAPSSRGLFLAKTEEAPQFLSERPEHGQPGPGVEVTRPGPLAVGLRWQARIALSGRPPLRSTVELSFPSSKSWIET
ncbi:MAG TPA: hypothetical protein VFF52_02250, partial [Isosphaeraceae bacterium]|nr:hypothetical protein [Isosphaeraceae bacterium]